MKVFRILYCGFLEKTSFADYKNNMNRIVDFYSVCIFDVYVFLRGAGRQDLKQAMH